MYRIKRGSLGRFLYLLFVATGPGVPGKASAAACVPPATNLVSWWRFETNLLDAWDSNNGSALVVTNYAAGRVGLGISNSFVTVPDAPSLHFTTGMTVHAWINGSTFTSAVPFTIVSKYEVPFSSVTATQSSFYFGVTNSHLIFMVSSNGLARTNVSVLSTQTLAAGQWYFVAATYDHVHLRLYINGTLSIARDFFSGIFPGTASLGIGAVPIGLPAGFEAADRFSGLIDEVAVYNRALSAEELSAIYNADGGGICLTGPAIFGPTNQAVPLNEDAIFSVSVLGNRPLSYQWRFNGTNLAGGTGSSLYLERVQSNRIGNYSVVVSNQVSSATSSVATLTLLPPLPCVAPPAGIISWWPFDRTQADVAGTNNGETVFPPPPPDNSFATGKVDFAVATRISIRNSDSLNFGTNADFSWEGWIKVPPTNFLGTFRQLTNSFVDKFQGSNGYALFLPDGRLGLQLSFTPLPFSNSAAFIAPGPDLRDNHFHHVACTVSRRTANGSHLYVDGANALTFDVTRFSGSLSNALPLILGITAAPFPGESKALTDEMTLYGRALTAEEIASIYQAGSAGKCKTVPTIVAQPQSQTVNENSNATFTVSASGVGLKYQWRFFSTNLPAATGSSLMLSNVSIANAGPYSVRVTNAFGSVTSSPALLTVHRLPVALCQSVIVSADSNCTAVASIDNGSFDPDGGPVLLSQSPPGPYALGSNSVTLTAFNPNGLSATCSATVVVIDATPPVMDCMTQPIVVEFSDESGAAVSFSVHARDNCSGEVPVSSVPASGSRFPIGTNAVISTATDAASNSSSCTFQIVVLGALGVLLDVQGDLLNLAGTVTRPPDARAVNAALENLNDALGSSLWLDQTHITRSRGESVFNNTKEAVQALSRMINQRHSSVDGALVQNLIDRIVRADRLLAVIAIQDATTAGVNPKKLSQASDELTKGDADISDGQYESGIAHYRDAWKIAEQLAFKLVVRLAAGQPVIEFGASAGDTFVIEASTNLIDWTDIATVPADPDGTVRFQDHARPGDLQYYRARRVQ